MTTARRPKREKSDQKFVRKRRRGSTGTSLPYFPDFPTALARSTSLDTLATRVPRRVRLVPHSGIGPRASIRVELPEGTVVKLLVLDVTGAIVDTPYAGWLPAGAHEFSGRFLPNGAYKLRLETPTTWCISGLMIG